jgi:hypothetical protein
MSLEFKLSPHEEEHYAKTCWFCDPDHPHPNMRSACIYCCKLFDLVKQLIGDGRECPGAGKPHRHFPAGRGFNHIYCERCRP